MAILVFFGVVLLFSLTLNVIDKVRSYNKTDNRSVWQDGDSVVVKPRDAHGDGFARRIEAPGKEQNAEKH